jgi:hypothetical protein
MIHSFVGLSNFFQTHIKDFAIIVAMLFKLSRKNSGYNGGPLPGPAMDAFINLRKQPVSEPVIAFPRTDLHSKTMNRFQTALLEHNFIIQYKKGPTCQPIIYPDFRRRPIIP